MERDALIEVFNASHRIKARSLVRLSSVDRDRLHSMVLGNTPAPDRHRALEAWFDLAPDGVTAAFESILKSSKDDAALRATAATYIGRLAGNNAEEVLQHALSHEQDLLVRIKIVAALGRVATPESIALLGDLANSRETALARQAQFALLLIAHRHGIEDFKFRPAEKPALAPPPGMLPMSLVPARPEDIRAAVTSLRGDTFRMLPSSELGIVIECQGRRMLLVLNALCGNDLLGDVWTRPTLLGIVALQAPTDGSYSVSRVILAGPAEDGLYVAVYRLDGTLLHWGTGHRRDDSCQIEVGSVQASGNSPIYLRIQVEHSKMHVAYAATGARKLERREPAPFVPPSLLAR